MVREAVIRVLEATGHVIAFVSLKPEDMVTEAVILVLKERGRSHG